ncbi:FAD-binding oxidoreductase [Paenibacillus alginolyticus]|uniref:FAD-binding oxidoreductase n=1 Tax=Paenibacillus alginolyticus TaxID=59839 RepID=A0ABT4GQ72_9BACL|nr:FAD-binding oxidoreductase [Paenibacillus alginolyticus]MCY9698275.1 FAD-binding oxidoreductase [Paenibacillus alginolyticus]MEC0148975.1 FAD-binding oxidoreductase [Paenibacillus alginolyticus]
MKKTIALLVLVILCLFNYIFLDKTDQDPFLITDYSRLHPVKVTRIIQGKEEEQLVQLIKEARDKKLTISIAGQRHSQGGHTYYKDGIVVDMKPYNKVLDFNPAAKTIRVQAGATWKDVQDYLNPYALSVKTMQSQNIFTVGGSISINAHGRDIRNGSLIESVQSFRLLMAKGQIKHVSRTENAELFPLALGGYGLFGIIMDVTLKLTDDELYRMNTTAMKVADYSSYFVQNVLANPDIHMHLARISVTPEQPLTEMYAINYTLDKTAPLTDHNKLKTSESGVIPSKLLFNLNRSFDWAKNTFWDLQKRYFDTQQGKLISRNNAMRSESAFMEYHNAGNNDLLQEYFIPIDQFAPFMDGMRTVLQQHNLNLLNITVRYVNKDQEAVLSYAKEDMFALVCLFNVPLSVQEQIKFKQGIQQVLDKVIQHRGTYYLPYVTYPTLAQFHAAYPRYGEFFSQKDKYDPQHLFMNYFYEEYKGE